MDSQKIGSVQNGSYLTSLQQVTTGDHTVYAYRSDNHSVAASMFIEVKDDSTFECELAHEKTLITFVSSNQPAIEVIDSAVLTKSEPTLLAFLSGSNLKTFSIPENIERIGNRAFSSCDLESISIPNSVISIGDEAFCCCESLSTIQLSDGVTRIGYHAFYYCNLKSIEIPNSVTSIGIGAFSSSESPTLIVGNGSYAEQYAYKNNVPYKSPINTNWLAN